MYETIRDIRVKTKGTTWSIIKLIKSLLSERTMENDQAQEI